MRPQRVVKNNLGILDFAEKKRMRGNAHRSKLFLDTKSFFALCNEIEKGLHSKQLNCFDVRNIQAVMNKSDDVTYGNL